MGTLLTDPRLAQCRRIFLRDWAIDANIGVYSAERHGTQRLVLNLDVYVALSASTPRNDDVREVIDYDFVRAVVQQRIARGHINLQETLVDDIVAELLRRPGVEAVRVSSQKTEIYADAGVAGIGVEVLRFREAS
ncbi:MAG TPA: dihydroneopterin aldolase [Burkholderiaceae bacterium]|nr:dihydroneopterin aldolase [Burkholderiaceae bacterium]